MTDEKQLRRSLVECGRSFFQRGYACGTSGNLSVRLPSGGYLLTPTNVSLGSLDPDALSRLDGDERHVDGHPPTKEAWLHLAMYASRPADNAVVHLHCTHAVALSCRTDLPHDDVVPAITPYVVMRVGRVPLVPYGRPGDSSLTATIKELSLGHRALLLANHGPVLAGVTLDAACAAAEELEETARLFALLEGRPYSVLTNDQVEELIRIFGK